MQPRTVLLAGLGLLAISGGWIAFGPAREAKAAPRSPDVVFFVVDTLRADRMSVYGAQRRTTPNLERWAKEGVTFDRAYAPAPWTLPSVASLLTGYYPETHGAGVWESVRSQHSPATALTPAALTLPEKLAQHGYNSACWTANAFLTLGCGQGFDPFFTAQGSADELVTWALEGLTTPHEKPAFVYLQPMDVHDPTPVPDDFFRRFPTPEADARIEKHRGFGETSLGIYQGRDLVNYATHRIAAYDGSIAYVDRAFGRLLEGLQAAGRLDSTYVFFLADHGEELWDHVVEEMEGYRDPRGYCGIGHGHTHFEELIHIPLLAWGPGFARGQRVATPVSLIDLPGTVLDLLGLGEKMRPDSPGRTLRPALLGNPLERVPLFFQQISYGYRRRAIIDERDRKLILSTNQEEATFAFDLVKDPKEKKNLAQTSEGASFDDLRAVIDRIVASQPPTLPMVEEARIEDAVLERLKAVGYFGGIQPAMKPASSRSSQPAGAESGPSAIGPDDDLTTDPAARYR